LVAASLVSLMVSAVDSTTAAAAFDFVLLILANSC
jgi:hypothetical protein